ncbi:extracellular matrix protein 2 [Perca flavescens]|uniref:extracellular matrix protein 2 n=1 Tax=Perca flavescens TaxID=8167 RepID=UPI00106E6F14|nr:extracellular matrix protein 2-like [Perca flavescens]
MTRLPIIHNLLATNLDMAENNIRIIAPQVFSGVPNLDTLDLSKNKLDDESFRQSPLSNLTFLKKLNVDGNQLTRIPALPPSLEELKMNNNKLSTLSPNCFKGLMNLLNLELEENTLHEGSVSPLAFRPLKRLLNLQLDNNRFRYLPLGLPPSLQELDMTENLIEAVTEEALRGCVHLRVLDLSHNLLHEQGIATHAWTRLKCQRVGVLRVVDSEKRGLCVPLLINTMWSSKERWAAELSGKDLEYKSEAHNWSLEALDLSYNRFTSVPMNLPRHLRKLTLQHNKISHIAAFTFRHMRSNLQSLHLSHNDLSNEGMERVSFVGTYRSLGELLLDNNRLGEIPRCVRQFKNLQVLRLDNNQIRLVRQWGVCHPRNSGSTLASIHLENNLLEVERIPPNAFSCLTDVQGLVLYPQQGHSYDQ